MNLVRGSKLHVCESLFFIRFVFTEDGKGGGGGLEQGCSRCMRVVQGSHLELVMQARRGCGMQDKLDVCAARYNGICQIIAWCSQLQKQASPVLIDSSERQVCVAGFQFEASAWNRSG